ANRFDDRRTPYVRLVRPTKGAWCGHSGTTLTDVARAAGVSLSTASLAFSGAGPISDATRDKVLAAAAELGYHGPNPVAASLRRGRSGVVGIVMGAAVRRAFRDPVSIQFLDGI